MTHSKLGLESEFMLSNIPRLLQRYSLCYCKEVFCAEYFINRRLSDELISTALVLGCAGVRIERLVPTLCVGTPFGRSSSANLFPNYRMIKGCCMQQAVPENGGTGRGAWERKKEGIIRDILLELPDVLLSVPAPFHLSSAGPSSSVKSRSITF